MTRLLIERNKQPPKPDKRPFNPYDLSDPNHPAAKMWERERKHRRGE